MTVRAPGLMFVFRPDHRMARRRHQLRLEPDAVQFFDEPVRAFRDFLCILGIGGNARETQEGIIIFKMSGAHEGHSRAKISRANFNRRHEIPVLFRL